MIVRGGLDSYVTSLLNSELPFGPGVAVFAWALLFVANQWIARALRVANDAQRSIVAEDWSALRRGLRPESIVAQAVIAGLVFLVGVQLGGGAYVFFVGGWIVATAFGLALGLQGLLAARALAKPNETTGTLTFRTASALRHTAQRLLGGAFACLVVGLIVAHLALVGGALFLAGTAVGGLRRAHKLAAHP